MYDKYFMIVLILCIITILCHPIILLLLFF
ncbi:unnamed protein product, partial [Vitis vinifera]|uniref:Uncharacterized protein n=1 Tax=Vitis vinifera TaxID=29760 RepID=E0CTF9_VITVI